jgi:hypothetical protein
MSSGALLCGREGLLTPAVPCGPPTPVVMLPLRPVSGVLCIQLECDGAADDGAVELTPFDMADHDPAAIPPTQPPPLVDHPPPPPPPSWPEVSATVLLLLLLELLLLPLTPEDQPPAALAPPGAALDALCRCVAGSKGVSQATCISMGGSHVCRQGRFEWSCLELQRVSANKLRAVSYPRCPTIARLLNNHSHAPHCLYCYNACTFPPPTHAHLTRSAHRAFDMLLTCAHKKCSPRQCKSAYRPKQVTYRGGARCCACAAASSSHNRCTRCHIRHPSIHTIQHTLRRWVHAWPGRGHETY